MKKLFIYSLILFLTILAACEEKSNNEPLEVSEDEKAIVNMESERDQLELILHTATSLEPIETIQISNTEYAKKLDPKEFNRYVPQESWITDVSRTLTKDGSEIHHLTVDYQLKNHRIIVEYYQDGFMRKSDLNRETGIFLVNDNGEYSKHYFEHHDKRKSED